MLLLIIAKAENSSKQLKIAIKIAKLNKSSGK